VTQTWAATRSVRGADSPFQVAARPRPRPGGPPQKTPRGGGGPRAPAPGGGREKKPATRSGPYASTGQAVRSLTRSETRPANTNDLPDRILRSDFVNVRPALPDETKIP